MSSIVRSDAITIWAGIDMTTESCEGTRMEKIALQPFGDLVWMAKA